MACLVIVKRPSTHLRPGPRCMRHESAKLPQGFAPAASLRARLDADHLEPSGGRLGQAPRRHRRRHRADRPPAAPRARPHVRPAQLAHAPPRRARHLRRVMTSMTRRAPPHSATISEVGAIVVSPETAPCALRRERATTHPLERPLLWPVLRRLRMAGFEVSTEEIDSGGPPKLPLGFARASTATARARCRRGG